MSELFRYFNLYGYEEDAERFEDIVFLIHLHGRLPYLIVYDKKKKPIKNLPINPTEEEIRILNQLGLLKGGYSLKYAGMDRLYVHYAEILDETRNREDFQDLVEERYMALAEASKQIDDAFKYPLREIADKVPVADTNIYMSSYMPTLSSMENFTQLEYTDPKLAFYMYYLQLYTKESWNNLAKALLSEGWLLITDKNFSRKTIFEESDYYRVSKELAFVWSEDVVKENRMLEQLYHEPDCLAIFCLGMLNLKPTFDCESFIEDFGLDPKPIFERMFEINEEIRQKAPEAKASRLVRMVEKGKPMLVIGNNQKYLEALNQFIK